MSVDISHYEVHPAATLFPPMDAASYEALKADIAEHGQKEDIIFWKGLLLDGRHRMRACQELGIEPSIAEYEEDTEVDPYQYVISHNLHRRHLTATQRSLVAAKLATLTNGQHKDAVQNCTASLDDAASLLNVSRRSVCTAKKVIDQGAKQLIEAVESGDIAVSLAAKLIDAEPNKKQQAKLAGQGKQAIREWIVPADEVEQVDDEPEPDEEDVIDTRQNARDAAAIAAFKSAANRLVVLAAVVKLLAPHELVWLKETIE